MQRSIAVQDLAVNYAIYLNKWLMKWCEGKEDKAKAINKVIRVLHRMGAHLLVELKLQDNVNDMVQDKMSLGANRRKFVTLRALNARRTLMIALLMLDNGTTDDVKTLMNHAT